MGRINHLGERASVQEALDFGILVNCLFSLLFEACDAIPCLTWSALVNCPSLITPLLPKIYGTPLVRSGSGSHTLCQESTQVSPTQITPTEKESKGIWHGDIGLSKIHICTDIQRIKDSFKETEKEEPLSSDYRVEFHVL